MDAKTPSFDEMGNESLSSPIIFPPNYDLLTGQTCLFLVHVASNMAIQWCEAGSPPSTYDWRPQNPCPVTSGKFDVSQWDFGDLIWSTFTTGGKLYTAPFGFTATYNGNNYLVFRGTKTKAEEEMDYDFSLTNYDPPTPNPPNNLKVEQGFYTVYNGLLEPLQQELKKLPDSSAPLTITGHSLGSALSTLAVPVAISIFENQISPNQMKVQHYNQASPMVGDSNFASYYNGLNCLTFRLVNTVDEVPKLPPQDLGYIHVGTEVAFTADNGSEPFNNHDSCCTYAYALNNPQNPVNPYFSNCMSSWGPNGDFCKNS